jgi:Calcium binding
MKKSAQDPIREDRIQEEAIVDAYGPEEKAMGWYYYLEGKLTFPFSAHYIGPKTTSPLRKGEIVEVSRMAMKGWQGTTIAYLPSTMGKEEACECDMLVQIKWQDRKMAVPLSQLIAIDPNESTEEAIGDWHYWVSQGYLFSTQSPPRR